jgi:hypothetical protein
MGSKGDFYLILIRYIRVWNLLVILFRFSGFDSFWDIIKNMKNYFGIK